MTRCTAIDTAVYLLSSELLRFAAETAMRLAECSRDVPTESCQTRPENGSHTYAVTITAPTLQDICNHAHSGRSVRACVRASSLQSGMGEANPLTT